MQPSSLRLLWNLGRYREIVGVLLKYGFGDLVQRLHLEATLELGRRVFTLGRKKRVRRLTRAQRIRLALEELGPTFVKFGQVLSTRPDVVPPDLFDELIKLQEQVPPFPTRKVFELLKAELKRPPGEIFAEFDPEPLAAASIAQVHRAVLNDGTNVAVKVRRPNVVNQVERDLAVMFHLAHLAERRLPENELYDPVGIVQEFARTIRREMDFVREGRTIDRFQQQYRSEATFYVPRVFWEWTTPAILTMEYVDGVRVSDMGALERAGLNRRMIAARGARLFLKQALLHGLFHGDLHPGNIRVLPGNVICLLDFGMVGRLDEELKGRLADLIISIVRDDVSELVDVFLTIGEPRAVVDRRELTADVRDFMDTYYGLSLEQLPVGNLLRDFVAILSRHRIQYPASLMLLARALITLEGVGRDLDPSFIMAEHLAPFVETLVRERHSPSRVAGRITSDALRSLEATRQLPMRISELIDRIEQEDLQIPFVHRGLDRLISELDRSSNRIAVGLVLAALIVASALIFQTGSGPQLFGWPALGLAGFLLSGFLGLWLVFGILRSGRL